MPGRGSYGPGGKWIYQRAKHLRAKNPNMEESTSFAIATQQAHKVNKSPKKFRTTGGIRTAKMKYNLPVKEYRKTAAIGPFKNYNEWGSFMLNNASSMSPETASNIHKRDVRLGRPTIPQIAKKLGRPVPTSFSHIKLAGFFDELESIEKEAGLGLKGAIVGLSLLGGLGAAKGLAPRAAAAMAKSSPAVTARAGDAMKIGLKALKSGKAGVGRFSRQGAEVQKAMGF